MILREGVNVYWRCIGRQIGLQIASFAATAPSNEQDSPVEVRIGNKSPEKQMPEHWVSVRLDQPLSLVKLKGANSVRFVLQNEGKS